VQRAALFARVAKADSKQGGRWVGCTASESAEGTKGWARRGDQWQGRAGVGYVGSHRFLWTRRAMGVKASGRCEGKK